MQGHEANSPICKEKAITRSALFAKLDAFIPKMKEANRDLEQLIARNGTQQYDLDLKDAAEDSDASDSIDANEDKPHIEMQFALSVMPDEVTEGTDAIEKVDGEDCMDSKLPTNSTPKLKLPSTSPNNSKASSKSSRPLITEIN